MTQMTNSSLRRTTFFKLTETDEDISVSKVLNENKCVGFPNLKKGSQNFSEIRNHENPKRHVRPKNKYVLMRTLFNRQVNNYILHYFNTSKLEQKMFDLTSKIISELWNEAPPGLTSYFSLLASLEDSWHKYTHYCSWDKASAHTLSMKPIEFSQARTRLQMSLTVGGGSAISTFTPKELCIITKTKPKKRKSPPCLSPKYDFKYKFKKKPSSRKMSNLSDLRFDFKHSPIAETNVLKKKYQVQNLLIEDLFLL